VSDSFLYWICLHIQVGFEFFFEAVIVHIDEVYLELEEFYGL